MLSKKLFLKPGHRFIILHAPDGFEKLLGAVPENSTREKKLQGEFDLILLFVKNKKELDAQWKQTVKALKQNGSLWVAYPKKSSGIESDLGMITGWEITTDSGWDGVSLISIDDTWSGARFIYKPEAAGKPKIASTENISDNDGLLCIDKKNRVITPPKDLQHLLHKKAKASSFFDSLSFTNKKEYVEWIITSKRKETRMQRLEQTIVKLMNGKKNPSEK